MKTKINFTIDSKEITKQITDVITSEAVSEARKIAKKQFDVALENKIETLIKAIDADIKPQYWTDSELRKTIVETTKKAIADMYKDNADSLQRFVETYCAAQIRKLHNACISEIKAARAQIENQIKQEVESYMKNAAIQAIFGNKKGGV